MSDYPGAERQAERSKFARGCEVVGCAIAFIAISTVLTLIGSATLSQVFSVPRLTAVLVAALGSIGLIALTAIAGSGIERASNRRTVKKWNSWKCPSCGANYNLKKGDAVRWLRRVYTINRGQRHTNEPGVRLTCRACEKKTNFLEDGRVDSFAPDDTVMLVGGHEMEVPIEE